MISPPLTAQKLLNDLGWLQPGDLSLEEIAFSLDGIIKYSPLTGSSGRILMNKESAIITVDSNISYEAKRNWVTAHEIGHLCLHNGLTPLFSDTEKTLSDWYKNGSQEQQANDFAAELLMPSSLFKQKAGGHRLSISLIQDLAQYFNVSLTTTFLRYRLLGDFPVMIVFIEDGLVKWKQHTPGFPFEYLPYGSKVPVYSVAGDLFYHGTSADTPEKVDAIEWFPEDFQIKFKSQWKLWEQCYRVSENGILSCLWTF
ncbi:ImmA/IrrE family metallo-endopeptidase [Pedobacter sp. BG31]|uniref:ImmA/IrrE family metallo-endopeptidase n=1 Tax=Pedobacter sp. BG31 TaxID=3349697 RepID=UPI0035F21E12